jgi:hypothetical protein
LTSGGCWIFSCGICGEGDFKVPGTGFARPLRHIKPGRVQSLRGPQLTADPRCRLVLGDFFAISSSGKGFDPENPERLFHAVLLDIDGR